MDKRNIKNGIVINKIADTTAKVEVKSKKIHKILNKHFTQTRRFLVEDKTNSKIGDSVTIVPCRKVSKKKAWKII